MLGNGRGLWFKSLMPAFLWHGLLGLSQGSLLLTLACASGTGDWYI